MQIRVRAHIAQATEALCSPTHALPIDIFRLLVGLLSSAYFVHLFAQVGDFSGPDGLIDHDLTQQLFWYTRIGLFEPGMTAPTFRLVFLFAAVASWALVFGYRVKPITAILFLIAVSAYRWNFLVIYVDDAIMHLVLFWLLLLPVGRTLVLSEWLRDRGRATERWKREMVSGGTVNCFLVNLSLVYLVAGLWKWTSPMWRDGTALYAALRMPIAFTPDFWRPDHLPMLRFANYSAMVLEPLIPLMLILPAKNRLKWALFAGCVAFHLGIVATMMIPYANLACIAAGPIIFRHEIMAWLGTSLHESRDNRTPAELCWCTRSALAFVVVLVLAMATEARVPSWRFPSRQETMAPTAQPSQALLTSSTVAGEKEGDGRVGFLKSEHNIFYAPLWLIGIAQSYRLFDWIDDRNFHVRYEITVQRGNGARHSVDPREVFPKNLRAVLLQLYLHDVTWGRVPRNRAAEFKAGLAARFANRFCRVHQSTGSIEVRSQVERTKAAGVIVAEDARLLMLFACQDGEASLLVPRADSGRSLADAR